MAIADEICRLNKELPKYNLVTMTSGNVSGRDINSGNIVIKPSGVSFDMLTPNKMVHMNLLGKVLQGGLEPSSDALSHLIIYKKMDDVNCIVHTHSNYATSFAALGMSIPMVLTAMADEFGEAIMCAPYCKIGAEDIGEAVVEYIGKSSAILLQNHGVFTIGKTPEAAFKSAVMVEDIAKTVHLAMLKGDPIKICESEVIRAHKRYKENYGQKY